MHVLKNLCSAALVAFSSTTINADIKEPDSIASCLAQEHLKFDARIERFEDGLRHKVQIIGENNTMNILDRMAHYKIPGIIPLVNQVCGFDLIFEPQV